MSSPRCFMAPCLTARWELAWSFLATRTCLSTVTARGVVGPSASRTKLLSTLAGPRWRPTKSFDASAGGKPPIMVSEIVKWCAACPTCRRFRAKAVQPPLRSTAALDQIGKTRPWDDVIANIQGPFTRAEMGEQCALSLHCVGLRVPRTSLAFREGTLPVRW